MQAFTWIFHNSANLKDLGVFLFGAIGAFFTYRAWRQKRDEIKEKYFERRYEVYSTVQSCVSKGLQLNDKFEWWMPLLEAKDRAEFLVSVDAKEIIGRIHDLLIDYRHKADSPDQEVRMSAKLESDLVVSELKKFNAMMQPYLRVGS